MAYQTFSLGGIHPRSLASDTLDLPIRNANLPHFTYLPMAQHIGAPATPVVKVGDHVHAGDLVGKASGFVSVNVHASLPGRVVEIGRKPAPFGAFVETVVIEFEGLMDLAAREADQNAWRTLSKKNVLDLLQEYGVVGLGGAMFPTHVKYAVPPDKRIEFLVINAVECEPYLSGDNRLLLERTGDILTGIEIARMLLGGPLVRIAIEADMPEAIAHLQAAVAGREGLEVVPLRVKYPQGSEKHLLKAVLGRTVPTGGLPMDVGAVVSNVGTLVAVKEAVVDRRPLTERVVTVTGKSVLRPGNYKVKLGTPVSDLLAEAGLKEKPGKIIVGGPMMGQAQFTDVVPVVKGTSGVLVLSKREAKLYPHRACVRCGKCIDACPMGLQPARLVTHLELARDAQSVAEGGLDCVECGCCSYVCPSQRHLAQTLKLGKLRHLARKKEAAGG